MPKDPQDSAEAASLGTAANTAAKLPLLQGALPLRAVLHLAIQIAQGLAFLHPTIIHRDLKPGVGCDIWEAGAGSQYYGVDNIQCPALLQPHSTRL
ncbi:protein kinase domain-containing protein [Haematococcus lacustris]|uniref:Protein kinase domain-containing protein n=1 Tax=Haematococcus lacustris TaxID=44745 RepID=A0A699YXX5_HAELA|nr:protein kinase domain-containing protein [Haematococcus lacustris]